MGTGGISDKLTALDKALVGWGRGGLAMVSMDNVSRYGDKLHIFCTQSVLRNTMQSDS